MDKIIIRKVEGKEDEKALELSFYAFHPSPGSLEKHRKFLPYYQETIKYILYENDKPASLIACKPLTQNVRNTIKPMCGIADVASNPETRRKGYVKQLMDTAFTHMKENKQGFSTLYPFKEAYYEKFGYIAFPQFRVARISPQSLTPLLEEKFGGTVERMSIAEGFQVYVDFLQELQPSIHGMALLPLSEIKRLKVDSPYWLAVARDGKKVVGILTYKITGYWKELRVRDFYYSNSKGKYLLLQWLGRHVDQLRQILMPIKPNETPDLWVSDTFWGEIGAIKTRDWAANPMGRVVIVEDLSGLHVGEGEISLAIEDPQCPWNNSAFTFEAKDGILQVKKTDTASETLSISGLSAVIYGSYNLEDFEYKKWGTLSPEIQKKIRTLFPPLTPYLHADF
ncbi:MAG: GNAT family N-acetyltransferase [Candidatus Ranarchaeia archaeon]|jgi:predicted GNAT family N-acyltransferase